MNKYDLSIIIPARNEMFLKNTVEDILKNKRGNTEIIVVLDGQLADPPIAQHPDVNIIYLSESIGQRAATNLGVRLSKAPYIMKLDGHCSWDEGCDIKMLEAFKETGDNTTMVPIMRNLWAFDWNCQDCNWKKYQGPTPEKCEQCGSIKIRRKLMWIAKNNPQSTSYCFDSEPHFQYFEDWKHRPQYIKDKKEKQLTETMSLQGSCFMCTRKRYWQLKICDEELGNWGNQGIEVAVKSWLSGGSVLCNHKTWYAHMFRTQGGDFSFPYPQSGNAVHKTKQKVKELLWSNRWPYQKYSLSIVIEHFWPIPGWDDRALSELKNNELKTEK